MNNTLTASRLHALQTCARKHYYQYELGLKSTGDTAALRFGTAWHKAMEARWNGKPFEEAFASAIPEGDQLDELQCATLSGLLAAYYNRYQGGEIVSQLYSEVQFNLGLDKSRTFQLAGKIDGLATLTDGTLAMIEHKTTGDSVDPDSDYWIRLKFNTQVYQYVLAARELGWDIQKIVYDVTRKPSIKPVQIPLLDENGIKIVLDRDGNRVLNKNGSPRQTGSAEEGYTLQTRTETPEEYRERLISDCAARPDFYFARREVAIIDQDLQEFEIARYELGKSIMAFRQRQKSLENPEHAWPRNVSADTCKFCQFQSFCLNRVQVSAEQPPVGFTVQFNPELQAA